VLEHGGRLRAAARQYAPFCKCELADWLDLSTGINPGAYPLPAIDPACWHRLPEDDDGLTRRRRPTTATIACWRCRDRRRRSSGCRRCFRRSSSRV
jgi:hypothetical protein